MVGGSSSVELVPCGRCGARIGRGAAFCGECGAPLPASVAVRLEIDVEPLAHLEVDARGLIRLRVVNDGGPVAGLALALTLGGEPLVAVETALPDALAPLATAHAVLAWTPTSAGFHTLTGTLEAGPVAFRVAPLHLRVGSEAKPVTVTIDQSHARVVDNSRSTFGAGPTGGLLGAGDWQPVDLEAVATPAPAALPDRPHFAPVSFAVTTASGTYAIDGTLAHGDLATVYRGQVRASGAPIALKLVDDRSDNDLVQHEVDVLAELTRPAAPDAPVASDATRHFPRVLDRMKTGDGRLGTIFEALDGMDLVELRRRLAARGEPGLAPRHLVWLMRRVLGALGWAHARGILHGNLDPTHLIIRPHDHMVWLVDWCWAIVNPALTGSGFKAKNEVYGPPEVALGKPPLPASDLYALGKCIIFAAGGDPVTKTLPPHPDLDPRLARFIQWLVQESPRGRPQDALALFLQVERLRAQIWGPHMFVPLDL